MMNSFDILKQEVVECLIRAEYKLSGVTNGLKPTSYC